MKQTLKRSLALLLCAALLMAAVPAAAAIKTTDFGAILEAGKKSVNSIYVVTDPLLQWVWKKNLAASQETSISLLKLLE